MENKENIKIIASLMIAALMMLPSSCTKEDYRHGFNMNDSYEFNSSFNNSGSPIVKLISENADVINWHCYPDEYSLNYPKAKIFIANKKNKEIKWMIEKIAPGKSRTIEKHIKIDNQGNIRFTGDASGQYSVYGIVNEDSPNEYKTNKITLNIYLALKYHVKMSVSDAFHQENGKVSAYIAQWTVLDEDAPYKYRKFLYSRNGYRDIVQSTLDNSLYAMGEAYVSRYYIENVPSIGNATESCYANIEPMYTLYDRTENKTGIELGIKFSNTAENYYIYFIKGEDYRTDFFK